MVSLRWSALSVVSSIVLVMAGCSGGGVPPPTGSAQAESAQAGSGRVESSSCDSSAQPSTGPDRDEISPLIMSVLAPDPIPVKGTDGSYQVAYELEVLNAAPRTATLTKAETLTNDAARRVATTVEGEDLLTRTLRVGSYPRESSPSTSIPAGVDAIPGDPSPGSSAANREPAAR
jgi:hypothetical protein